MTGRWAGVPVTASEGTPAPLAATVDASPRVPSLAGEGEPSPGPSPAPDPGAATMPWEAFDETHPDHEWWVGDDMRKCRVPNGCPIHPVVPPAPSAPDCDDRAVRLALAAGAANLRLLLVRDALKDCCEADRNRILGALGRETA